MDEDFNIIFNESLSNADFPALEFVGSNLIIEVNPQLSEAEVNEIVDGVDVAGDVRIANNGG